MTAIAVVGSWHLAQVTSACLAELGHNVTCFIEASTGPVEEPGLAKLQSAMRGYGRLRQTTLADPSTSVEFDAMRKAPVIWLAMDTWLDDHGGPNMEPMFDVVRRLPSQFHKMELLVVSSQVSVGTCRKIEEIVKVPVAYVPENLRIGHALEGFRRPDRLVIGARLDTTNRQVKALLPSHRETICCSLETAEMIKHATNAFLATSISFANEIGRICKQVGADADEVTLALRTDSRIGPKAYVESGRAFGNGTLERDVRALVDVMWGSYRSQSIHETPLLEAVLKVNASMPKSEPTAHEKHLRTTK